MAKEAIYSVFKTVCTGIENDKPVYGETVEIMTGDTKKTLRRNLAGILGTKNVDSEAAKSAVDFLGGEAYAELFANAGDPNDLITVKIDGEKDSEYKRANVAARVRIATIVDTFSGTIFTAKKADTGSVKQEVSAE
jgi:hypothetical protein